MGRRSRHRVPLKGLAAILPGPRSRPSMAGSAMIGIPAASLSSSTWLWPAPRVIGGDQRNALGTPRRCSHWPKCACLVAERGCNAAVTFMNAVTRSQWIFARMNNRPSAVVLVVEDEPLVRLDAIDTLT